MAKNAADPRRSFGGCAEIAVDRKKPVRSVKLSSGTIIGATVVDRNAYRPVNGTETDGESRLSAAVLEILCLDEWAA